MTRSCFVRGLFLDELHQRVHESDALGELEDDAYAAAPALPLLAQVLGLLGVVLHADRDHAVSHSERGTQRLTRQLVDPADGDDDEPRIGLRPRRHLTQAERLADA